MLPRWRTRNDVMLYICCLETTIYNFITIITKTTDEYKIFVIQTQYTVSFNAKSMQVKTVG